MSKTERKRKIIGIIFKDNPRLKEYFLEGINEIDDSVNGKIFDNRIRHIFKTLVYFIKNKIWHSK